MLAAGTDHSYFLLDDGIVERTRGLGKTHTVAGDEESDVPTGRYVSVGSQMIGTKGRYGEGAAYHHYLIRSDGAAVRVMIFGGEGHTLLPPSGCKYVDASATEMCSYLLRSDGCVDRVQRGNVQTTMNPPPGTSYVSVKAGRFSSYFLRSDGLVDRTMGGGTIDQAG